MATGDSPDMAIADPVAVYTAHNVVEADTVRIFLEQEGIKAFADQGRYDILWLLFAWPPSSRKLRVWVNQLDTRRAKALLAEYDERQHACPAIRVAVAAAGRVMAVCEECGKTSWFPDSQRGTTQNCPFCYAYVDVGEVESPGELSPGDTLPDE